MSTCVSDIWCILYSSAGGSESSCSVLVYQCASAYAYRTHSALLHEKHRTIYGESAQSPHHLPSRPFLFCTSGISDSSQLEKVMKLNPHFSCNLEPFGLQLSSSWLLVSFFNNSYSVLVRSSVVCSVFVHTPELVEMAVVVHWQHLNPCHTVHQHCSILEPVEPDQPVHAPADLAALLPLALFSLFLSISVSLLLCCSMFIC